MTDNLEFQRQLEVNRRFYSAHAEEIRKCHAGNYIGIAFGRIVITHPDFFEVCRFLEGMVPKPAHQTAFLAEDVPAFEPIESSYPGEFLPWDESYVNVPRTDGTLSTRSLAPDMNS